MSIERVSNVFIFDKKNFNQKINEKLILKELHGRTNEQINKYKDTHRVVIVENAGGLLTVKADEEITKLLSGRNFKNVEIKHSSGEKEVLQTKVNIQTLTKAEAQELNRAVESFLKSIVIARQEQVKEESPREPTERESKESKWINANLTDAPERPTQLKPSDYLKEARTISLKDKSNRWIDNLKEEEKRSEEHSKKQEEKAAARKQEILKKENQKWEMKHEPFR